MVMLLRRHADGYAKGEKGYTATEEQAAHYLKPVAYDPTTHIFVNNDQSVGFMFECHPVSGARHDTETSMEGLLQLDWPDDTMLSFMMFRSPDIRQYVQNMWDLRKNNMSDDFTTQYLVGQQEWLYKHTVEPLQVGASFVRIHDNKLTVSVKFHPNDGELDNDKFMDKVSLLQTQTTSILSAVGLSPTAMTADRYKRFMKTIFHWGPDAEWKQGNVRCDPYESISDQIIEPGTAIDVSQDGLKIGNDRADGGKINVQSFAIKESPEMQYFGNTMAFVGEVYNQPNPIMSNYAITTNVFLPNKEKFKTKISLKEKLTMSQANSPLAKALPSIRYKAVQIKELVRSLEKHRPVRLSTTALLFTYTDDEKTSATQKFKGMMRAQGQIFIEDVYKAWPSFVNSLPMCAEKGAVDMLGYYRSMTAEHVPVQLPIFGEWKGHYHKPQMTLIGRNGQVMGWTLHSEELAHFITTAGSGAGKSFKINDMIMAYNSTGARMWMLDRGGSYFNLCKLLGGTYVDFDLDGGDVPYSFNPFAAVHNFHTESEEIYQIIKTMVCWHDQMSDTRAAILKNAIKAAWEQKGNQATITDVAMILNTDGEAEGRMMSQVLHQFTEHGAYGKWFMGNKRPPWGERFTVVETQGLTNLSDQLRTIIMMAILAQIRGAMYDPAKREQIKMLLVDEAWALLGEPAMVSFLEILAREARKYSGLMGLITQTPGELQNTSGSKTIIEQAATKHVMRIASTGIAAAREMKYLGDEELVYDTLETLRTVSEKRGGFSEIYIDSMGGSGVGRLVVPPLRAALYSSTGDDVKFMRSKQKEGMSVMDAARALTEMREAGKKIS